MKNTLPKSRIMASLLIFFFYAAAGAVFPILSPLFLEKQFPIQQIAAILLIPNILYFITGPIWAYVADRFQIHRHLLTLAMAGTIPFIISLIWVNTFWWVLICFGLFAFNFAPLFALTDDAILTLLEKNETDFGKIRVWGSISFGLSALLVGALADMLYLSVSYIMYAIFMGVCIIISLSMEQPEIKTQKLTWDSVKNFIQDPFWLLFLCGVLLSGYGQSIIMNYFPALLLSLGATNTSIGLAINVSTVSEIPVMLGSAYLIKKYPSKYLLICAFVALLIRSLGYVLINRADCLILFQLFHGLSSSLFWVTAVVYIRQEAPRNLHATALSILSAIYYGFAGGLGSFGGGSLLAYSSFKVLFLSGTVLAIFGVLVFLFLPIRSGNSKLEVE